MPIASLNRTIISLSGGDDPAEFLAGLITNTLRGPASFAALLTPQGKIIADFFVTVDDDRLLLDTPAKFGDVLLTRLKMYRLRAKVDIDDVSSELKTYVLWGENFSGHVDPRHPKLGFRKIVKKMDADSASPDFDLHRLKLGIPDSRTDFDTGQVFPHDVNMDRLSGIDFKKGCFVGQEVVSRMQRKTEVRKRACAFTHKGAKKGDTLKLDGKTVGEIMHVRAGRGMALVRLDRLSGERDIETESGAPVSLRGDL